MKSKRDGLSSVRKKKRTRRKGFDTEKGKGTNRAYKGDKRNG